MTARVKPRRPSRTETVKVRGREVILAQENLHSAQRIWKVWRSNEPEFVHISCFITECHGCYCNSSLLGTFWQNTSRRRQQVCETVHVEPCQTKLACCAKVTRLTWFPQPLDSRVASVAPALTIWDFVQGFIGWELLWSRLHAAQEAKDVRSQFRSEGKTWRTSCSSSWYGRTPFRRSRDRRNAWHRRRGFARGSHSTPRWLLGFSCLQVFGKFWEQSPCANSKVCNQFHCAGQPRSSGQWR